MDQFNKPTFSVENLLAERILEHSSDLISLHQLDGTFVYASSASLQLLKYEPEELIGRTLFELLHPFDREYIGTQGVLKEFHKNVACRIRRREGDYIWLETTIQPINQTAENEEELILCISRDITTRKLAEQELKENIEKYQQLVEHSHDTIGIITKEEGAFTFINETGKKLFGATSTYEIIGKTIYDFIIPKDHSKIRERIESPHNHTNLIRSMETTIIRNDQEKKYINMKLIPTVYKGRKTMQVIIHDITEQKLTEEKLQQTEKLSVVGHLAAGIAHEIRNPLTAIKGFTQLIGEENNNQYVDVMLSELNRIEKIVSDLLILAKPEIKHFERSNLNKLIDDIVSLLNTQAIMKNIEIATIFSEENMTVDCEPDKLKQVLINIIKNAIEASFKDGKILIETKWINGNKVLIKITDNGIGIPNDRLPKLGEPFYSTKEKGTGLGLMICKRIVKNHNGTIKITSKVNKGTVVKIILPKSQHSN
ncbi:PAS domain-containing sensor histidine kinase [Pueribacillus theae]|uniref:histidine kinase n=1 Tax=Pueribacillus theae TaxID=2171751 RepID=A0A2U1K6P2_9BACI|nr:PAS domain-containing sensor histidine kinase [Pueribacillus theae]PWA12839.1 PAS domain-containing sensor histidine kinase [Pueribacillus theae]